MKTLILLRGGGDLASGVAIRLHRAGYKLVITELSEPLAVRRLVAFSEALYEGQKTVEDVTARHVQFDELDNVFKQDWIPVIEDPRADILEKLQFSAVVDARLTKSAPQPLPVPVPLLIGLGPGFNAGHDCHAVIETRRGHTLGRVFYSGSTLPDSTQPDGDPRRVLRAPVAGRLTTHAGIGEHVEQGQRIAEIIGENERFTLTSPLKGVLRGLLRDGMQVSRNLKLGDVDPRDDLSLCRLVSDKALAIGGAVLEVLLSARQIPNF
jgi:xanthine dehydrogenase accessory factor